MKNVGICGGRRLRALAALLTAMASFIAITGAAIGASTQSSTTLAAGGNGITFSGDIMAAPNVAGPIVGCGSGSEPNCAFITFTAQATGTATVTLTSQTDNMFGQPEELDIAVLCNDQVRHPGMSTDPVTGTLTATFEVNAGEVCTIRITTFLPLTIEPSLAFTGKVTLLAETVVVTNGFVTGGGQVLSPNTSFTSNAKPAKNGFEGTVRFFNSSSCKFQSRVITQVLTTMTTDSSGNTYKTAVITGYGRVNTGTGWVDDPAQFHAKAEDHGQRGDRFGIDKCGAPADAAISSGQITIHDK